MKKGQGFLSAIMILIIVFASTILVVSVVNPILDEGKKSQSVNDAKQVLQTVNNVVSQLSYEASGAKRSIDINLQDGRFIFSGHDNSLRIRLNDVNLLKPGTAIEEDNILLQGGGVLNVYQANNASSLKDDLVLENDFVLFAVKKLGSEASPVFINTSNIIDLIDNKRQNVSITPTTGIFINEKTNSSYGIGYTRLLAANNVQTGSVLLHMNSTANITYDAIFSLSAGDDFIDLSVKNIMGK